MTHDTPPKRIWACPMRDGGGFGPGDEDDPPIWAEGYWDQVQDGSKDENEYILASEHAALIREAEARVWRDAGMVARLTMAADPTADEYTCSLCAKEIRKAAEAASIRATKATP